MTKKHFIALADTIINSAPKDRSAQGAFTRSAILELAEFCKSQNPDFNRERWLDYIDGKCGQNGGKASAPDLLSALIALEKASRKALDTSATHDGLENCKTLLEARVAIAKAKGEA